jgi:predicted nucleic acid-binding protein
MRLVLDTNVLVSGFLWEGRPRQLLDLATDKEIVFCTSAPILAELREAVSVQPVHIPRTVSDVDDDLIIGTAIAAKADLIVTGDKALLSVAQYQGVHIVSVVDALRILNAV